MTEYRIERVTAVSSRHVEAVTRLAPSLASGNQVSITAEYLRQVAGNDANVWLIAISPDGEIVGMAVLIVFHLPTNIRAFLENLVVDENHRRRGVGAALIERAKQEADSRLVNTIRADAGVSNVASNALLAKAGFTSEDSMNHYEFHILEGRRF